MPFLVPTIIVSDSINTCLHNKSHLEDFRHFMISQSHKLSYTDFELLKTLNSVIYHLTVHGTQVFCLSTGTSCNSSEQILWDQEWVIIVFPSPDHFKLFVQRVLQICFHQMCKIGPITGNASYFLLLIWVSTLVSMFKIIIGTLFFTFWFFISFSIYLKCFL